ncbi:MAG: carbohydrate kinase [Chthoniobacterales bacterium]|nr:carbohydrate kinase [Chthoniobacterales bacterium]
MDTSAKHSPTNRPRVVGVGELLWDLLPTGRQMGGAPANFIYHARSLGADAHLLSRVGTDALGVEILGKIEALGLPTAGIQTDPTRPTGTVAVELAADGQPIFNIHDNAAWDNIQLDDAAQALVSTADAIYFGSLAQRSHTSSATIRALLSIVPSGALRVFDANLRQEFFSRELLHDSLSSANVLKINEAELDIMAGLFLLGRSREEQLTELVRRYNFLLVACTRGAEGSILCDGRRLCRGGGCHVVVQDTIGAGDSFTAAMTMGLLCNLSMEEISELANGVAAHVSSQRGATPGMPPRFRNQLQQHAKEVCYAS